jgi:hypothetical protein
VAGSYEQGNELLDHIKGGEFLGQLSDCQLVKKDRPSCTQLNNYFE